MQEILFKYELNPTTWAYLSSLITIGVYFKFRRFWSMRNLDLIALIAFSPGLLLIYHGLADGYVSWQVQSGYVWLFGVGAFFLIRLLLDPIVVRRPLLEPNLSASGLTFTGIALLVFLMANVVNPKSVHRLEDVLGAPTRPGQEVAGAPAQATGEVLDVPAQTDEKPADAPARYGPGYPPFYRFAGDPNRAAIAVDKTQAQRYRQALIRRASTRTIAILGHLAVVIGMVLIGYRHFDNIHTGVAAAVLYLLLPYTAHMTSHVDHVVPAALLVWAVQFYRRPVLAGIMLGLAAGVIYYPLFLLPLWCGFYWRRGLVRFAIGVIAALALLVGLLALSPASLGSFSDQLRQMFGVLNPLHADLAGFWQHHIEVFRIPVIAAFVALCGSLALWPAQKNLGTLLSCSAAAMLGTQFWQAQYGGIYMAWYLPLLLLTVFRPNLEDRVAVSALAEGRWWWKGKKGVGSGVLKTIQATAAVFVPRW